jgi:hypothetical protein
MTKSFREARLMVFHSLNAAKYIADQSGMTEISSEIDCIIKEIHAQSQKENAAHIEKSIPKAGQ